MSINSHLEAPAIHERPINERVQKVLDYCKDHPDSSWKTFMNDTGVKISDAYYYMIRKGRCSPVYNKAEPGGTSRVRFHGHGLFQKSAVETAPMNGKRPGRKPRQAVYISLFSTSSAGMTDEHKSVMKQLLDQINDVKGTSFEIVEHPDLQELEIREQGRF